MHIYVYAYIVSTKTVFAKLGPPKQNKKNEKCTECKTAISANTHEMVKYNNCKRPKEQKRVHSKTS